MDPVTHPTIAPGEKTIHEVRGRVRADHCAGHISCGMLSRCVFVYPNLCRGLSSSSFVLSAAARRHRSTAETFIERKKTRKLRENPVSSVRDTRPKDSRSLIDSRDISRASVSSIQTERPVTDDVEEEKGRSAENPARDSESASRKRVPRWLMIQNRKKLLSAFRLNDAASVWELHPTAKKDLWTFDQMIAVMAKNGLINKAFKLYQSMKKAGVHPGSGTFMWLLIACTRAPTDTGGAYIPRCYYVLDEMAKFRVSPTIQHFNFALQTCANFKDGARAEDIIAIMQQHKISPDVNSYTALIKAWSASVSKILQVWNQLKGTVGPDIRAYNTLLSALKESSNPLICLKIFKEMKEAGPKPDKHSVSILFDTLIKEGQLKEASALLDDVLTSHPFQMDTQLANKLISVASRARSHARLGQVLDLMKSNAIPYDDSTYESLIAAYGRLGLVDDCVRVYQTFKTERPKAISIRTFTGLLLACRHSARVDLLRQIEEDMRGAHIEVDDVFLKLRNEVYQKLEAS